MEVTWFAVSNRVYDLLLSTNFTRSASNAWSGIAGWTNRAGIEATMTYTSSVPATGQQLFRVRVRRP